MKNRKIILLLGFLLLLSLSISWFNHITANKEGEKKYQQLLKFVYENKEVRAHHFKDQEKIGTEYLFIVLAEEHPSIEKRFVLNLYCQTSVGEKRPKIFGCLWRDADLPFEEKLLFHQTYEFGSGDYKKIRSLFKERIKILGKAG